MGKSRCTTALDTSPLQDAPSAVRHSRWRITSPDVLMLYDRLIGRKVKTWPLQPLRGGRIPYGPQHNTLVSLAGTLRARNVCDEAIEACLQIVNESQCTHGERPGPRVHISEIVRSSRRWGATAWLRHQRRPKNGYRIFRRQGDDGKGWRQDLLMSDRGAPRAVLANAITALRLAPEWDGVLGFNEFSTCTVTLKPPPWTTEGSRSDWTDHEDRLTADWLQHQGIYVSVEIAGLAVQTVACDRTFHPVREYLDSLKWDGTKRIDDWLSLYLGVEI